MTSILTECANNIVGKLINLIIAETRHVCCFKCIVNDFEKEKEELEAKWTTIRKDVEDARKRAEDIRDNVIYWQGQAENLIKEDTKTKMACFGGWCPNCIRRYNRGKELAQKADDIRRLKVINFESIGHDPRLPGVEYHSSQGFIHFESRDLGYNQLLEALSDDNNYMTGLQGMGGTGKTTLAKEVGRKLQESGKFDCVIFTIVSNAPDIKKIQDSIAGPLGLSLKDKNEWERPKILWKRLTDGQKILIILDDVWELNFEEIGIPSSESNKNCRVLLTTRDIRVCNSMGCPRPIQLGLLLEHEAWTLFKKHAGIDDNSFKIFQDKGQEITKECKGLPVAVAAIASTLKARPLEEWNAALTTLRSPMPMHDVNENLIEVYKCLRYSYDNLKNEKAKRLFLLISVFPAVQEFHTEGLTRLGIGVGIFGEVDKYSEARSQVLVVKNKLVDSCLLLKGEEGWLKMHDLVREVALWIANEDIQVLMLSDKKQKALTEKEKKIKYLLCDDLQVKDMDVFPSWFDGAKIEILIIIIEASDTVEVPNAFFEKMTTLRVLVLTNKALSKLALSLPFSVLSLTNIRSLILTDWKLGDISILGTLRSLETLDLDSCSISELPNKITELEKLRLLRLDDCEIERNNPFEVIERCLPLEELYLIGNELPILDNVNEAYAIHQNRIFPTLSRYHLQKDKKMNDSISKIVSLPNIDALISEATFKYLVQGAEILQLKGIKGVWRNLIPEIVPMEDGGMNDLVELSLKSCSKIEFLINTKHIYSRVLNVFSKLVALKLKSMDNLEELCSGPLPSEFLRSLERLHLKECKHLQGILFKSKLNLCNLKIMTLEGCPMLVSLFQPSTARSLILLEKLRILECEQLTDIITDERSKDRNEEILDGDNDHKSNGSMFPKLKILEIERCHRLECILSVLCPQDIPQLETIVIVDCDQLKHIFGQYQHEDQHVLLGSLQKLKLSGLSNFKNISLKCYPPLSSLVKRSSSGNDSKAKQPDCSNSNFLSRSCICCYRHKYKQKLGNAPSINMPEVSRDGQIDCSISLILNSESLHPVESAQCLSKQSQGLNILITRNIREITLEGLDKVEYLFNLSTASSMMLESLRIGMCPRLKHMIDMGDCCDGKNLDAVFPNLKVLYVYSCDQFEFMFGQYPLDHQNYKEIHIHLPALKRVSLDNLPNFISICPKNSLSMMWPSLKQFDVNGCPLFAVTSISDFTVDLDTRELDGTITKGFQGSNSEEISERFDIAQSLLRQSLYLLNVRYMTLKGCPKMISLFTFSVASTMLMEGLKIIECHRLKHLITDVGDGKDRNNFVSIFPKLKSIFVMDCDQLEYVIGQNHHVNHDHNVEVHMHLPALKELTFQNLSNMIDICPRNYVVTCSPLEKFVLDGCPQFIINSISDLMVSLYSRQPVSTTSKDTVGIEKHFLTLETLCIRNIKLENILCVNGLQIFGRTMSLGLQYLELVNLPHVACICLGSKDSFTFQNLKTLLISGCEKLEVIFPASVLRCLPKLECLVIKECKELKHIIEEDVENRKLSPCFPKLAALVVIQCHKLKHLISVSTSDDLLNLEVLIINGSSKLEELIICEQGQGNDIEKLKVKLPKLKLLILMQLSSLCGGIELQTVRHRVLNNCPNLCLKSTATLQELKVKFWDIDLVGDAKGRGLRRKLFNMIDQMIKSDEVSISEVATTQFSVGLEAQTALPSLQINEESKKEVVGDVPDPEIPAITTSPTDLELIERPSSSSLDVPLNKTYLHSETRLSQTETCTDKESDGHAINITDFRDDDLISLFQPVEEDGDGQISTSSDSVVTEKHPATKDNLVVKVLADLEESLKMPLKDIASTEANSLRLLTALNFLSRLPLEDATLSDELKSIIDSLHHEFPSILCSFRQAFSTTNKFAVLEEKEKSVKEELAHRNEEAITLISRISKAKNFMDEAQQKEAILKEQIMRLEKQIKDHESELSSLQEEKKKFVAETIVYKKEYETVRKDKSQMVEYQRKARQELFEVGYKWSALCSQFEHNRIEARIL